MRAFTSEHDFHVSSRNCEDNLMGQLPLKLKTQLNPAVEFMNARPNHKYRFLQYVRPCLLQELGFLKELFGFFDFSFNQLKIGNRHAECKTWLDLLIAPR